jgi:hypothetical protein
MAPSRQIALQSPAGQWSNSWNSSSTLPACASASR